jgi:Flp pilus assembly protein CpaB
MLVALAVVLAFVLNILALQDRSASSLVAVADQPIAAGAVFMPDMVRLTPIDAGFEGLESMVGEAGLTGYAGWIVQRAVAEGGVIEVSVLAEPATSSGLRSMSIPIDVSRAAGGTIAVGDRVDVIAVDDGVAAFVVVDIEVVSVAADSAGALRSSDHHLVVAIDANQALALAEAMAAGDINVIRSTGAPPLAGEGR